MVRFKRIAIAVGILLITMGFVFFMFQKKATTGVPAPSAPVEQAQLAAEHAHCAAYFMLMRSSEKSSSGPDSAKEIKNYTKDIEHHLKIGAKLSPDQALFKSQVEKAFWEITDGVNQAGDNGKVSEFVDGKLDQCIRALFRTEKFIQRLHHEKNK